MKSAIEKTFGKFGIDYCDYSVSVDHRKTKKKPVKVQGSSYGYEQHNV